MSRSNQCLIFIFNIKNNYSDYAKCSKFINALYTGSHLNSDMIEPIEGYCILSSKDPLFSNRQQRVQTIEEDLLQEEYVRINKITQLQKIQNALTDYKKIAFHFHINTCNEDDIVNLQYFFLLKQVFWSGSFCELITGVIKIDTNDSQIIEELPFKLGQYLIFETRKDIDCIFYLNKNDLVVRLPWGSGGRFSIRRLSRFFPLLEISRESYDALSLSVVDVVRKVKEIIEPKHLPNYELIDLPEGNLLEMLFWNTSAFLVDVNKRDENIDCFSEAFFEMIQALPLLTLILFATFRFHSISQKSNTLIDIYEASDFAEGILQLIENVTEHSQSKKGYFSFRIHSGNSNYLNEEYEEYFEFVKHKSGEQSLYLEMFVLDARDRRLDILSDKLKPNKSPVCDVFFNNIKNRIDNKEIYLEKYLESIQKITLKDFFGTSSFLREYEAHYLNLTRHYGLKRFSNSVGVSNGFFWAVSTYENYATKNESFRVIGAKHEEEIIEENTIPGTKYKVLLPIKGISIQQKFVGVDTNVNSINSMNLFLVEKWFQIEIEPEKIQFSYKNQFIIKLGDRILEQLIFHENPNQIFVFDIFKYKYNYSKFTAEILCKSILYAITRYRENKDIELNFAIYNCPTLFIPECLHNIMIVYDRFNKTKRTIMHNTQIFFCSSDFLNDFLLTGQNLNEMRKQLYLRSAFHGVYPSWLLLLDYILDKQDVIEHTQMSTQFLTKTELPFDLLVSIENRTIFEHRTQQIMEKNIQGMDLGCKFNDMHVRIGSKIHVHHFYEAELLFQNNYFTIRFAALLVKDIVNKLLFYAPKKIPIQIVGYGNYSEMLIYQTNMMLALAVKTYSEIHETRVLPYVICEANEGGINWRYESKSDDENIVYIFVVPINSTLSTHNKMFSSIKSKLGKSELPILANYALILIRDQICNEVASELEKRFWYDVCDREIETHLINPNVKYYVETRNKWEDPLLCTLCYPTGEPLNEKPLIETNMTSIIPTLQFGLHVSRSKREKTKNERIAELAEVVHYRHIERGENHYLYYFATDLFYEKNKDNIMKWLKGIKNSVPQKIRTYNFIVSPLHDSNARLVELVNHIMFDSAAQVLRFNINREYRSNIKAKYSSLETLYENLKQGYRLLDSPSEINFYYVDDEIVSGRTINRAKSLIESIFSQTSKDVKVSVFNGIFVLVNRLSNDSMQNYIQDIDQYYYYVNLPISSIRNHEDFCYMCQLVKDATSLAKASATNDLSLKWIDISKNFEHLTYGIDDLGKCGEVKAKQRLIAACDTSIEYNNLDEPENIQQVFVMLINLLGRKMNKKIGIFSQTYNNKVIFESYLKALARPFLVYQRSIRGALLALLHIFSEVALGSDINDVFKRSPFLISLNIKKDQTEKDKRITNEKINFFKNSHPKTNNEEIKNENIKLKEIDKQLKDHMNIFTYLCELCKWIEKRCKDNVEDKCEIIILVIEQLKELNSNYLIRKEIVHKILKVREYLTLSENEEQLLKLDLEYQVAIKQLTGLRSDESKSTRLEYLLLNGVEYTEISTGMTMVRDNDFINTLWNTQPSLGLQLYLENTKVLSDAMQHLSKFFRNAKSIFNDDEYYLDNFRKILHFNGLLKYENNEWSYVERKTSKGEIITTETNIQKMIDLNKYLKKIRESFNNLSENNNLFSEDRFDADDIVNIYTIICNHIEGITSSNCVQLLLVPEANTNEPDVMVVADSRNKNNKENHNKRRIKSLFSKPEINKVHFQMKTFAFIDSENKLIIKLVDIKNGKVQSIYLALKLSDWSQFGWSPMMKYIFVLRGVLLFRDDMKTIILRHFTSNLFLEWKHQELKNILLSNIKHSSHTEENILLGFVNEIIIPEKRQLSALNILNDGLGKYIAQLQAASYRLFSDIFISSNYHSAIVYPIESSEIIDQEKDNQYDKQRLFNKDGKGFCGNFCEDVLSRINQITNISNHKILIDLDIEKTKILHRWSHEESVLLIFSAIENAVKNSPINGTIKIYSECTDSSLGYICIKNTVEPSCLFAYEGSLEEKMAKLVYDMNECILKPIEERTKESLKGIALFAINHYCKKLLLNCNNENNIFTDILGKSTKNIFVKVLVGEDINTPNTIIVKIPLLIMEGE